MFFNVCLHLRSFLLRADWWKSDSSLDAEPQGNWSWNSNSREVVSSFLLAGLVGRGKHVLNGAYQEGELYRLCGGM